MVGIGVRRSSGIVSITVANTTTLLLTIATGKKAILTFLSWNNRTGGNGYLRIGYVDVVGAAFQQVLPDILMFGGPAINGFRLANELPKIGNTVDGFCADTTATAGSTGTIVAQATVAGAAPADIQVLIEVEEL